MFAYGIIVIPERDLMKLLCFYIRTQRCVKAMNDYTILIS